ncbi:alpha/beta hydrolase [Dietzia sp. DQ11-38-2]|uniref:alpha/beta fold hydrolase n=1 Tax=Dietzia sp. DQ11-38-2 TaxID=2711155 RepID=UPI0019D5C6B4
MLLLPLTTSVPLWAWLPLLVLGLGGLVWLVAARRRRWVRPAAVGVVAIAAIGSVLASQTLAVTPPITGPDGEPVPGSIASMEAVELNGSEQWITLRGHDTSNPVLLNLGMGGPGGGGFFNSREFRPLEEHFTVVNWDEPGTGRSYGAVPFDELDRQRFVDDAAALARYLIERFGQERIVVYGVSWSSILGIWLVQEHPELFHAFVSSGQMVNTGENDRMGYELALAHLEEQGETRRADRLRENGPPPYHGENVVRPYVDFLDVLNEIMGTPRYTLVVPLLGFFVPEYGYLDTINHTRGLIDSFNAVYPQLEDLDFVEQAPELEVPVFFFVGRHDVNAMPSLVQEYYDVLDAPTKELIWLEGGHGLGSAENTDVFVDVMLEQVRPLAVA